MRWLRGARGAQPRTEVRDLVALRLRQRRRVDAELELLQPPQARPRVLERRRARVEESAQLIAEHPVAGHQCLHAPARRGDLRVAAVEVVRHRSHREAGTLPLALQARMLSSQCISSLLENLCGVASSPDARHGSPSCDAGPLLSVLPGQAARATRSRRLADYNVKYVFSCLKSAGATQDRARGGCNLGGAAGL